MDVVDRSKELVYGAKELVLDLAWLVAWLLVTWLVHWLDLIAWLALLNCRFEI